MSNIRDASFLKLTSFSARVGTVRRVCRNVKRWLKRRDGVALDRRRRDGGSRRLPSIESLKHLPLLRVALAAHQSIPRQMFQEILRLIAELRPQPPPAPA